MSLPLFMVEDRMVMIGKSGAESKRQISENTPLQIGPSSFGTTYLQMP
jgi:hypothetical protein